MNFSLNLSVSLVTLLFNRFGIVQFLIFSRLPLWVDEMGGDPKLILDKWNKWIQGDRTRYRKVTKKLVSVVSKTYNLVDCLMSCDQFSPLDHEEANHTRDMKIGNRGKLPRPTPLENIILYRNLKQVDHEKPRKIKPLLFFILPARTFEEIQQASSCHYFSWLRIWKIRPTRISYYKLPVWSYFSPLRVESMWSDCTEFHCIQFFCKPS